MVIVIFIILIIIIYFKYKKEIKMTKYKLSNNSSYKKDNKRSQLFPSFYTNRNSMNDNAINQNYSENYLKE